MRRNAFTRRQSDAGLREFHFGLTRKQMEQLLPTTRSATPLWRRRNARCFGTGAIAKTRAAGARKSASCRSPATGTASSRWRRSNGRKPKSCAGPFARCSPSARAKARKVCGCFEISFEFLPRKVREGDHPSARLRAKDGGRGVSGESVLGNGRPLHYAAHGPPPPLRFRFAGADERLTGSFRRSRGR